MTQHQRWLTYRHQYTAASVLLVFFFSIASAAHSATTCVDNLTQNKNKNKIQFFLLIVNITLFCNCAPLSSPLSSSSSMRYIISSFGRCCSILNVRRARANLPISRHVQWVRTRYAHFIYNFRINFIGSQLFIEFYIVSQCDATVVIVFYLHFLNHNQPFVHSFVWCAFLFSI